MSEEINNNIGMSFSTIPAYDMIKQKIVNQLAIAENAYSNYIVKQDSIKLKYARTALIKLSHAVSDYIYLLEESEAKQYFCLFLANPDQWQNVTDFGGVLAVCKDITYKLGITQIEMAKLPHYESYKELE
jgi:hypothetical protein